jgi:hypothetical protein
VCVCVHRAEVARGSGTGGQTQVRQVSPRSRERSGKRSWNTSSSSTKLRGRKKPTNAPLQVNPTCPCTRTQSEHCRSCTTLPRCPTCAHATAGCPARWPRTPSRRCGQERRSSCRGERREERSARVGGRDRQVGRGRVPHYVAAADGRAVRQPPAGAPSNTHAHAACTQHSPAPTCTPPLHSTATAGDGQKGMGRHVLRRGVIQLELVAVGVRCLDARIRPQELDERTQLLVNHRLLCHLHEPLHLILHTGRRASNRPDTDTRTPSEGRCCKAVWLARGHGVNGAVPHAGGRDPGSPRPTTRTPRSLLPPPPHPPSYPPGRRCHSCSPRRPAPGSACWR